jgi:hypothetical protein
MNIRHTSISGPNNTVATRATRTVRDCPVCKREISLYADGTFYRHGARGAECLGSHTTHQENTMNRNTTTRTEHTQYTHLWDGTVPVQPTTFQTADEAANYVRKSIEANPDFAHRYGKIVSRTVTITCTEWEEPASASAHNPSESEDLSTGADDYPDEDEWEAYDRAEIDAQRAEVEEERAATLAARMTCEKTRDGWKFSTNGTLTDADAGALTFRAEPEQVTMGASVEVHDAGGIRIGGSIPCDVQAAPGPPYVVCEIDLM